MTRFFITFAVFALVGSLAACSGEGDINAGITEIAFPAYKMEETQTMSAAAIVDMVNNTPAFRLAFPLQKNWKLETEKGDETIPTGEFFTLVYIYESDKLIGYIGFSPFVFTVPDDTPKEGAYPVIFPNLRMSSQYQWTPYTCVKETDNGEVGVVSINYMDPDDIENHPCAMPEVDRFTTTGIVTYDMELKVSVGIAFMPGTVSAEQAAEIAKEVEILSEKDAAR